MSWTCDGVTNRGNTDRKHQPKQVDGNICLECGLAKTEVEVLPRHQKNLVVFMAFLVLFVLGLGVYFTYQNFQTSGPEPIPPSPPGIGDSQDELAVDSPEETVHRNTRYGIAVNVPESWELRKSKQDYSLNVLSGTKDLFQLLSPDEDGSYRENILVKIEQVESNREFLDEYASLQDARINQIGTFVVESSKPVELNGEQVHEIIYSGDNGEYELKRRRIIAKPRLDDDYFILITYTADKNEFEKYVSDIEKVFSSISLL